MRLKNKKKNEILYIGRRLSWLRNIEDLQIKLQGKITPHYNDESTKLAWDGSTPRSKKCYSVKGGSTKEIHDPKDFDIGDFEVEEGYKNFSVLIFSFDTLEFLYLKSSGHRRAIHKWNNGYESTWLVP